MSFLNWYDVLTPTTPYAAAFFGIIFTIIMAATVWYKHKETKNSWHCCTSWSKFYIRMCPRSGRHWVLWVKIRH
ncbi:hypothetical protein D1970_19320 [Mesobacillus zeae]|uniref:Uncharacterized protein n=1 Tax=Mesobacillus zeae TaxID=1917180 RepID=A0A398B3I6_9BACI|nr:hypothetical protein D1970_19320 [Mesobacillus zeae]